MPKREVTACEPLPSYFMDQIHFQRLMLAGAISILLAACSPVRQTDPPQTATEQLLISHAVERSVNNMILPIPKGTKVFLDTQYFDTDASILLPKYTEGTVRDRLLQLGCQMVDDRKAADLIITMRTGGQSIDEDSTLIGIPSIGVPVPLSGELKTPEVAFYKSHRQFGISKLAITATKQDGTLVGVTGPSLGKSRDVRYTIFFYGYTRGDTYATDPRK